MSSSSYFYVQESLKKLLQSVGFGVKLRYDLVFIGVIWLTSLGESKIFWLSQVAVYKISIDFPRRCFEHVWLVRSLQVSERHSQDSLV